MGLSPQIMRQLLGKMQQNNQQLPPNQGPYQIPDWYGLPDQSDPSGNDVDEPRSGLLESPDLVGGLLDGIIGGSSSNAQPVVGNLGGHRSSPNGIPAPIPYVGPPRMDLSITGLKNFRGTGSGTNSLMPGMSKAMTTFSTPPAMGNPVHTGPVTSQSLASSLMSSRGAM